MGEVWFYHLTDLTPQTALPALLERALAQGWRVELRGRDPARMAALDAELWLAEGFVPHGVAGGAHDALQPVLLTTGPGSGKFDCIMAVDGADVQPAEAAGHARVCILFDGNESQATDLARDQWRQMTAAGLAARYWAEEGGRWTLRHERPASASG